MCHLRCALTLREDKLSLRSGRWAGGRVGGTGRRRCRAAGCLPASPRGVGEATGWTQPSGDRAGGCQWAPGQEGARRGARALGRRSYQLLSPLRFLCASRWSDSAQGHRERGTTGGARRRQGTRGQTMLSGRICQGRGGATAFDLGFCGGRATFPGCAAWVGTRLGPVFSSVGTAFS